MDNIPRNRKVGPPREPWGNSVRIMGIHTTGSAVKKKTQLIRNGKRIGCKKSNYVPFVVPGLSASSSSTTPSPTSPSSSSQESTSANRDSVSENRGVESPVSARSGGTNEEPRRDPLH